MGRPRKRYGWHYNADREQFELANGIKITLHELVTARQNEALGKHALHGEWSGWTINAQCLRGPGGMRIKAATARMFWRWLEWHEEPMMNTASKVHDELERISAKARQQGGRNT